MRLYDDLADWWPLMSPPAEYEAGSVPVARLLSAGAAGRPRLLQLGAGGGHLASHLETRFDMTLVDLSLRMLDGSRRLNPDCRHLTGDMRSLRLDETFDAVLVFDAISHMTTEADLLATMRTACAHLTPGGVALFCPDWTVERFVPGASMGGIDGPERGMRYLEWTQPMIRRTTYESDFVYLLREADGTRRVVHDRMVLGIFSRDTWARLLAEAGFGQVVIAEESGRDVFQAWAAPGSATSI
ncbi:class I SAM-dependent methyltransferase [Phaeovulum sp. NW3]|uniref:class I SAM-dependent methyltransferase n=1 Tax=Phaeovulum sp. NW3 TaxID=2934933 RepID=UPI002022971F|nr:class I SAM-dependent methyltransferase [Phaeovulum sp. NW3]MCL7466202.1 methyltransferase domain-containing protein [Phaeovulum sp. NW3]